MVCPYTWEVPGGVQEHVKDLAEALIGLGHEVSVITPADDDTPLPDYEVPAGRAIPVPYNGSVARLAFGFVSAARTRAAARQRAAERNGNGNGYSDSAAAVEASETGSP